MPNKKWLSFIVLEKMENKLFQNSTFEKNRERCFLNFKKYKTGRDYLILSGF